MTLNNMLLSLEGLDIDLSIVGDINLVQKRICKKKKYILNYEKNELLTMKVLGCQL